MVRDLPPDCSHDQLLSHFSNLYGLNAPDWQNRPPLQGAHPVLHVRIWSMCYTIVYYMCISMYILYIYIYIYIVYCLYISCVLYYYCALYVSTVLSICITILVTHLTVSNHTLTHACIHLYYTVRSL